MMDRNLTVVTLNHLKEMLKKVQKTRSDNGSGGLEKNNWGRQSM